MTSRVTRVLLLLVMVLVVVRFVNPSADFPRELRNWSGDIYTDEGWYNGAAAEHVRTGSWYAPGDMNTAINHPVSPLIQRAVFAVFGMNLASARLTVCAAFTLTVAMVFILAKRFADPLGAALAALLFAVNFLVFGYSRIATLDVLSTMFAVAALLVVMRRDRPPAPAEIAAGGALLAVAILTKGSAGFAVPLAAAGAWMPGRTFRQNLRQSAAIALIPSIVVGAYIGIAYRAFPDDYANYFGTVAPDATNPFETLYEAVKGFTGLGRAFAFGTALLALMGLVFSRAWRQSRLTWLCLAWIVVFVILLSTRTYVAPRYYVPLAVPLALLAGTAVTYIAAGRHPLMVAGLAWMVLGAVVTIEGRKIVEYLRTPQYSFVEMARQVAAIVREGERLNGARPGRLLGVVAGSVGLETRILTLGSVYGPKSIGWKLDHYDPTHWIRFEDEKILPEVESRYQLSLVGSWDVFDNYYGSHQPVRLFALERRRPSSATR